MGDRKDCVQVRNEIFELNLNTFTPTELTIFWYLAMQFKRKEESKIMLETREIMEGTKYSRYTSIVKFSEELEKTLNKLLDIKGRVEHENGITGFNLIIEYDFSEDLEDIEIKLNPRFMYLLNDFTKNFTYWEFEEWNSLSSIYARKMYIWLKQFKATGAVYTTIEEFRSRLGIPNSYRMGNITQNVLNPIKEELSEIFENLEIKQKKGRGRNRRKITHLEFTFKPEKVKREKDETKDEDGEHIWTGEETSWQEFL